MILLVLLLGAVAMAVAATAIAILRAPEGFEDELGFHVQSATHNAWSSASMESNPGIPGPVESRNSSAGFGDRDETSLSTGLLDAR
ncbi:MAG: hypothetical protein HZC55_25630 [Verrucomicrobia bacterium]|nr:hypothetical protein [Verrucomicrobiota bacterium]